MLVDLAREKDILDFIRTKVFSLKILVIGDMILDGYLYGDVERISPEAPVPINHVVRRKETLGGAANVANNLASLGCQTTVFGVVGEDHYADTLHNLMQQININDTGLLVGRESTTTKIRIVSNNQQMMRLDFEETAPIDCNIEKEMIAAIHKSIWDNVDAVIISDYKKGVCTPTVCQQVISIAHEANIPVFVDPKGKNWDKYLGADYITPNVKELGDVLGMKLKNTDLDIDCVANQIRQQYKIGTLVVTRSEKGMSLYSDTDTIHMPTVAQEVYDVSGAGDTVITVLAAAIASSLSLEKASYVANLAAGIEVSKAGTYAVKNDEMLKALSYEE